MNEPFPEPEPGAPVSDRLQSLLSRAVEDQLSEQRQVAGVLAEVRGLLVVLREDIREASAAPAVQAVAGELTRLGDLLRADGAEHAAALDRVRADLASVAAVPVALTGLQHELSTLSERLAAQTGGQAGGAEVGRLADRVGALDGELAAVRDRLDALGAELAGVNRMLESVGSVVARANADTEQRLAAHVDEAVLALAEALLRRRGSVQPVESAPPPPASTPSPAEPLPPPAVAPPDAGHLEESRARAEYDRGHAAAVLADLQGADVDAPDDADDEPPTGSRPVPDAPARSWAEPEPPGEDDDTGPERRGWWRR